jgi:hypothetical protein
LRILAARALAQNNVNAMRKIADRFEDYDWPEEASMLRRRAT